MEAVRSPPERRTEDYQNQQRNDNWHDDAFPITTALRPAWRKTLGSNCEDFLTFEVFNGFLQFLFSPPLFPRDSTGFPQVVFTFSTGVKTFSTATHEFIRPWGILGEFLPMAEVSHKTLVFINLCKQKQP
jgi:hypothetical protein